ncbi:MAG: thiamine diphosphokinase [Thermoleophilia bacterium]|nr:thiamine diphosphokinase [Thermoleophilia bacterium]
MQDTVVVVAGGGAPAPGWADAVPAGAPVVAADGGVETALAAGLAPTVCVGDFDSAAPALLERAEALGARIERHRADKDATDLELALETALALAPRRILVAGSAGGRLDHLLASLLLLASERWAAVSIDAILGPARAHVVRGARALDASPGETVTLLALHGPAHGVSTKGLAYTLADETLQPGSSRGVSNVVTASPIRIEVRVGVLIALFPGGHT